MQAVKQIVHIYSPQTISTEMLKCSIISYIPSPIVLSILESHNTYKFKWTSAILSAANAMPKANTP